MKAARIHEWGNVDVIQVEEIDKPTPKEEEVLIEVYAAGMNPIDWKAREGYLSRFMENCFPYPLGWDVSGRIVALGKDVTEFKVGDEVFGLIRFPLPAGTFAEYVVAPVNEIALKPQKYDHIHAAAVPLVGLTAWQALFQTAHLRPKQSVLIHAASGGVGQMAIQIAKNLGAKVIATGSTNAKSLLIDLDIDEFINYQTEEFDEKLKEIDVVLDPLAGETGLRSVNVLKKGGKLVMLLSDQFDEIAEKAKTKNIEATRMIVTPNGKQLVELSHLIDKGVIKMNILKIFSLSQIKEAFNLMQTGHCHGKIVIQMKE